MSINFKEQITSVKSEYRAWAKAEALTETENKIREKTKQSQKLVLYKILAQNLDIVEKVVTAFDINNINMQLEALNIKTTKDTAIETKIVKLAMTKERKQAAVYACVLKNARQQQIDSNNFVDWLVQQGGIEKLRNKERLEKQIVHDSKQFDEGKKLALAKSKLATVKLDIAQTQKNELVLLVGRVDGNNEVEIVEVAGVGESNELLEKAVRNIKKAEDDKAADIKAASTAKDKKVAALLSGKIVTQ